MNRLIDKATVICVGEMNWFFDFPDPGILLSENKMGLDLTGSGQGNSNLCGQDALVWNVPEPVTVLSDGKMGLERTGSLTRQL